MIIINKVIVPESTGDGGGRLNYHDGKLVSYEHGSVVNVYLWHETDGEETRAFEITIQAPLTFDKCVNGAEMSAYGLSNALDVASFNASLARKTRNGEDLDKVKEHDNFIKQVKLELCSLGLGDETDVLNITKQLKIAEVEAYDSSDAVNSFSIIKDGQAITTWITPDKRADYALSIESAKKLQMTEVTPVFNGVPVTISVELADLALAQIQIYANRCYNVTETHKAVINALTSVEAVEAYDYTTGYPQKLEFTVGD